MGAGIAKTIFAQFPEALAADKATAYRDKSKFGTISTASIEIANTKFVVVNAYTQFHWKGRGRKADFDAISACFDRVAEDFSSMRIGYLAIGAGLAGGDWITIGPRISTALVGRDCSIPDDHIDPRRSALFMARSILNEVRDGRSAC